MKVKDAMHNGAEWVTPEITVAEMARKMKDLDIGALPVGENDRLIGMVTDRDITCRAVSDGKNFLTLTAREVMSKGVVFCTDTEEVEDALRIMEKNQVRRLPVINSKKRMVGMLSIGDISHATSHEMSGEVISRCIGAPCLVAERLMGLFWQRRSRRDREGGRAGFICLESAKIRVPSWHRVNWPFFSKPSVHSPNCRAMAR